MSRVALHIGGDVEERIAAEVMIDNGNTLTRRARTTAELRELVDAGEIDIAVVNANSSQLTPELIDACDLAGIRLIAVVTVDSDRRHALTLDFHETCGSDSTWESMVELLRPPNFDGRGIPDLSFFDITTDLPPVPIPASRPAAVTAQIPAVAPSADVIEPAHIVAVWGPAGAPGRTTVAINVAAELALQGLRVLLIDADAYGGSIAPKLGLLDETPGFAAVCRLADHELLTRHEFERIAQQVRVTDASMWVLTGILRAERWPELSAHRVTRVLDICGEFVDAIVIDVGFNLESDEEISSDLFSPRRNAATLAVLGRAHTVLAVADSDVVGLARFLRALPDVQQLCVGTPILTVANRVRSRVAGIAARANVRQTLERFGGLSDIAVLPHDDRTLDACSLQAAPLCAIAPRSAIRMEIRAIAVRCAASLGILAVSPSVERARLGRRHRGRMTLG